MQTTLDGIDRRTVPTARIDAAILERPADGPARRTVVLVHGNVSSSIFWQPTMLALPGDVRAIAVDLRGFGDSPTLPVDATRGVRDFSDDVAAVLDALGVTGADVVGWSMGGGIAMQLTIDRGDLVRTLTLVSPVSPYGFGGTGDGGRLLSGEWAGTGGGGANPDFVARLAAGDTTDESPTSPRSVFRSSYVADPARHAELEDLWVASMLTTATGVDNYPGDAVTAEDWPGFGPGDHGVLNTMAPRFFDVSGIVELASKPPILWVRGLKDAIVGDASFFDLNMLGKAGVIPGWPGDDVAPPQPMVAQTREVLERYKAAGGAYTELALDDCGHSAHLEQPDAFRAALLTHIG